MSKITKETDADFFKEELVLSLLHEIGEDPGREGLIGTPARVVKMWKEIFRGYDKTQKPKITLFTNGKDGIFYDQMIIDTGTFYSHCEHHMVPFFGHYWFGYIPNPKGSLLGLSKVARVVDFYSSRLQIQERLVHDIVSELWNSLCKEYPLYPPLGMGLVMKGTHLCKVMRGAKKEGIMTTTSLKGAFLEEHTVKNEFLNLCK